MFKLLSPAILNSKDIPSVRNVGASAWGILSFDFLETEILTITLSIPGSNLKSNLSYLTLFPFVITSYITECVCVDNPFEIKSIQ